MQLSINSMKTFVLAAFAAAALCVGPGSSIASAAVAEWNPAGMVKQTGQLEFRVNGGSPVTCTVLAEGEASGSVFAHKVVKSAPCSNGKTITLFLGQSAWKSEAGNFYVNILPGPQQTSAPWGGNFSQDWTMNVPFTNGSAGTYSKITFSNTQVGRLFNGCCTFQGFVTATGFLKVTTPLGGLVTLK